MFSGGPINQMNFKEGWALGYSFGPRKAHYFEGSIWPITVCGADIEPFMHIGDWTACKKCVAKRGNPTIQQREVSRDVRLEMAVIMSAEKGMGNG